MGVGGGVDAVEESTEDHGGSLPAAGMAGVPMPGVSMSGLQRGCSQGEARRVACSRVERVARRGPARRGRVAGRLHAYGRRRVLRAMVRSRAVIHSCDPAPASTRNRYTFPTPLPVWNAAKGDLHYARHVGLLWHARGVEVYRDAWLDDHVRSGATTYGLNEVTTGCLVGDRPVSLECAETVDVSQERPEGTVRHLYEACRHRRSDARV